jgi:hypothetical protein
VIQRREIEERFPNARIFIVPPSQLPDGMRDEATRVLLTEVGLPDRLLDVIEIDPRITGGIGTVGDMYRRQPPPTGSDGLFLLGHAGPSLLAVDGTTGAVAQVHEDFGTRPFASSLETFVIVLGAVSVLVDQYQKQGEFDTPAFTGRLTAKAFEELRRLDPDALPAAEAAWSDVLSDLAANAVWE